MIHRYESLGSTNEHLARMAEKGSPEFTAVLAGRQTAGRGRGQRKWWSPTGNLYLSVLIRPEVTAAVLPRVSILSSLALFRAVGIENGGVTLKWPNDLLLDGRKLAGVLPTARTEGRKIAWIIAGFGVNVRIPEVDVPPGLEGRIAFLNEMVNLAPAELAVRVIGELKRLAGSFEGSGWEEVRREWSRYAVFGRTYTLSDGGVRIEGTPVGLAEDGGLVMETEGGRVTVYAGELEETVRGTMCEEPGSEPSHE